MFQSDANGFGSAFVTYDCNFSYADIRLHGYAQENPAAIVLI